MTLKKLDDPDSKKFWDYVEKSKQEWLDQQPSWSRDLDRRQEQSTTENEDAGSPVLNCTAAIQS